MDKRAMVLSSLKTLYSAASPTEDGLRAQIEEMCAIGFFSTLTEVDRNYVARHYMAERPVRMDAGEVIVDQRRPFSQWYPNARKNIKPFFADRYMEYLRDSVGFPEPVVNRIDEVTDKICSLLGNPHSDHAWDRRGMVVGNVQSGKTANYAAVICKAADAGYKLIVIIAGIHNNLRRQTQERVDAGFIGFDTTPGTNQHNPIGVGTIRDDAALRPIPLTDTFEDFNRAAFNKSKFGLAQTNVPGVCVIKKNKSTLEHLNRWIDNQTSGRHAGVLNRFPMLLIDDEADNASINTSKDPDRATTINRLIRQFLTKFEKSTYVGYTATPFANIFINPPDGTSGGTEVGDDLFPRDFVYALDAPSNYVGADRLFGADAELAHCVRPVDDHADILPLRHKKDIALYVLPPSLREAIRCFVIARAIRLLRGHEGKHMSMLVNASRFTDVQICLKDLVRKEVKMLEEAIRYRQRPGADDRFDALYATWVGCGYSDAHENWETLASVLLDSVASIEVVAINSSSDDALNYSEYDSGRTVIAIGGFSLSRGLTLEGLTVSYLLRNTKMYDTLLQMGRWFGYRPDYEDVCRLFMTEESTGWYQFITGASAELRSEIKAMSKAGRSPSDFGLKVARHPASLLITARNKMRAGTVWRLQVGLASSFIETTRVYGGTDADRRHAKNNFAAAKNLVNDATQYAAREHKEAEDREQEAVEDLGYHFWSAVHVKHVRHFLARFQNRDESIHTQTPPLLAYIDRRAEGELKHWDIALTKTGSSERDLGADELGVQVQCIRRTIGNWPTNNAREHQLSADGRVECVFIGNKNRVGDARMEKIGLNGTQICRAEDAWKNTSAFKNAESRGKKLDPPGRIWRAERTRPLLILHAIEMMTPAPKAPEGEKAEKGKPVEGLDPVLAYSISFPSSEFEEETVEYVVNPVWMTVEGFENGDDDEDEEMVDA